MANMANTGVNTTHVRMHTIARDRLNLALARLQVAGVVMSQIDALDIAVELLEAELSKHDRGVHVLKGGAVEPITPARKQTKTRRG